MSELNKGKNNPMYGKRGAETGFYGKCHSKETKKKMSKSAKNVWNKPEIRAKHSGKNHPYYGKFRSEETKQKMSNSLKGKYVRDKNPNWKGNNVKYGAIHNRAKRIDPKPKDGICELCNKVIDKYGKTKLVHSNKDHSYRMPINPDEWWWVHKSCHRKYDNKNNIFHVKLPFY